MNPILSALAPVVVAALPVIAAWVANEAKKYLAVRTYAANVAVLATRAKAVAADLQRRVDDVKNPDTPGKWSSDAGAAVRADAILRVRRLEPLAVKSVLAALDGDEAKLDDLIGTHVEEAVRALRPSRDA